MFQKIADQLKNFLFITGSLFLWVAPFAMFLLAISLPKFIWNLSFSDYLDFLKILVWPVTALIILFFFKKVITYLFFSIDGFNFFGAKGELKNVYDVIAEKVDQRFQVEKKDRESKIEKEELLKQLSNKDEQKEAVEELIKLWDNSRQTNKKLIEENNQLRELIKKKAQFSGNTPFVSGESEFGVGDKVDNGSPVTPAEDKKDE